MKLIPLIAVLIFFCAHPCAAQPVSSTELIEQAAQYDGKVISYEGEAVGEVMARGNNAWVNIHDGSNAIGVWMSRDLAVGINYAGSYRFRGDTVEVKGIFHRACPEHGGDLDIHAQSLRKVSSGRALIERINPGKKHLVLVFLIILCLIWILTLFKRK